MSDEREPPNASDVDEPDELDELDDEELEKLAEIPEGKVSLDDVDIKDLLRKAMDPPREPGNIAENVQKKLREEFKGKYFADGWSTATAPRETYLVTSLVMLVVVVLIWLFLGPYGL
jgi:hypothetical protein